MAKLETVREILHWLVDAVSKPGYEGATATPHEVRAAIDSAYGYVKPEPALGPAEQAQLNALLAKQREVDAQRAAAAAEVEQHDDAGA